MGILNVTPDSFSDGGSYASAADAADAAKRMMDDGADLIDVGGESTRPGAEPVAADEELLRVMPVVERLVQQDIPVSIDTMKAAVARAAVETGAVVVNDVSAMADPAMLEVVGRTNATVSLMHMQGKPPTMQQAPHYDDVTQDVRAFLLAAAARAEAGGIPRNRIWIDPGIGFGKTDAHNLGLLANLGSLVETGYPVMIGVSRKGFLGRVLGGAGVFERLPAALAIQAVAQTNGVRIVRTHDVLPTRQAVAAVSTVASVARDRGE
jgi:dihydropteroate synthase